MKKNDHRKVDQLLYIEIGKKALIDAGVSEDHAEIEIISLLNNFVKNIDERGGHSNDTNN